MDISAIKKKLDNSVDSSASDNHFPHKIAELAEAIALAANKSESSEEKIRRKNLAPLLANNQAKNFIFEMTDRIARLKNPELQSEVFNQLLTKYNAAKMFSGKQKILLQIFPWLSSIFPNYSGLKILEELQKQSEGVIKVWDLNNISPYMEKTKHKGIRTNINLLGEAILGEDEAQKRLNSYEQLLSEPKIDYISVKLSSLYSQFSPLSWKSSEGIIAQRLEKLFSLCMDTNSKQIKFINFDMEYYAELEFVIELFKSTLSKDKFKNLSAGVAIQCYLPNSENVYHSLLEFAKQRVENKGAPIKIRLVKGANLNVEKAESSIKNWPLPMYKTKTEVDANFKRMLDLSLQPDNLKYIHIGIASHNIFDISYGLFLWGKNNYSKSISFEMLEGMAPALSRVLAEICQNVILYTPIVSPKDFHSAIAYLVRRLDENTTDGNFLREIFSLAVGNSAWEKQKEHFYESFKLKEHKNKFNENSIKTASERFDAEENFTNCTDSDWREIEIRAKVRDSFKKISQLEIEPIPLCVEGRHINLSDTETGSSPNPGEKRAYTYSVANIGIVDNAFSSAANGHKDWDSLDINIRKNILTKCAELIEKNRFHLAATMAYDVSKSVYEGDGEVSEAIDFANYYIKNYQNHLKLCPQLESKSLGTVVVAPPWNFPLAIPAGGIFAALSAGNSVILKPAPEAVLTSWELCKILWEAGVPKNVLQFLPCRDDQTGKHLICHERAQAVILTGSLETARLFYSWKPELNLFAETSGKNSIIVSSQADLDLAVQGIVHSAFSHNGQKCSACSLLILPKDVYANKKFLSQLKDATASLPAGHSYDFKNKITGLSLEPESKLKRALSQLDDGESWLLEPRNIEGRIWTPGIKLGVKPGSWFQQNECFGPVLGIICAEDLRGAVRIANENMFGLTAGLYSLDPLEIDYWKKHIEAGNLYVNRSITGAIVQRQPFGGWKNSVVGKGAKAGGPNYLWQFCQNSMPINGEYQNMLPSNLKNYWKEKTADYLSQTDWKIFLEYLGDFHYSWNEHFAEAKDFTGLKYESNFFQYKPHAKLLFRVQKKDQALEVLKIVMAASITANKLEISAALNDYHFEKLADIHNVSYICEDLPHLIQRLPQEPVGLRYFSLEPPKRKLLEQLRKTNIYFNSGPVSQSGYLELKAFLREQSVCHLIHRYGNITV